MTKRAGLFEGVDSAGVRTFGDEITIAFSDIPAEIGDGVWEAPGERVEVIDGFPIATTRPSIGLHLEDWTRAPRAGDTITRGGVEYDVGEVVPDGQGGVAVELVLPRPVG
jgi:hypothetical protein